MIEREVAEKYNAKLINVYTFPSQQLWRNMGDKSAKNIPLKSLVGKKSALTAAHSATLLKA